MPINLSLLIASPTLQDALISKTGIPLANGIVTAYSNTNQTMLKNWYYQSGTAPPYNYITLPNPMTLSAAGTIVDVNGNDIIPFFYPYASDNITQETYFITVYDQFGTFQFSRYNFPFTGNNNSLLTVDTLENYIINNRFWRNIGGINTPATDTPGVTLPYSTILAPSQHDGFSFPDFQFIKNNLSASDGIFFVKFTPSTSPILKNDITPEYYINHACTVAGTGETQKIYQFPISFRIDTLANIPYTTTIQAQSISGANEIMLFLYQFTGTGTSSPDPILIGEGIITLNSAWTKYSLEDVFPNSVGLVLSNASDDAFYLQIGMPLNDVCNLNFTLPSLYLSNSDDIPTNSFQTYDQIDSVISTPRTGDLRISINMFYPYGWAPMNDGTIGYNPDGMATYLPTSRNNQDTWPLYNLIWVEFAGFNNGSSNILVPMFDTDGNPVLAGSSAIADFNASKSLSLTKLMGQVILGTVPTSAFLTNYKSNFTASDSAGNLLITSINTVNLFNGQTFFVENSGGTFPGGLVGAEIYYIVNFNPMTLTFNVATSFANYLSSIVLPYSSAGSGTNTFFSSYTSTSLGETQHTQLESELATHHHPGSTLATSAVTVGVTSGGTMLTLNTPLGSSSVNVANDGSSKPFNVVQPSVYYNIFIKL